MFSHTCTFEELRDGQTFYLAVVPEDGEPSTPLRWCQYVKLSSTLIVATAEASGLSTQHFTRIPREIADTLECRTRLNIDHGPDQPVYAPGLFYAVRTFASLYVGCVFHYRGCGYVKASPARACVIGWEASAQPGRPVAVPFAPGERVRARGLEDRLRARA